MWVLVLVQVAELVKKDYGGVDFLVHSIAMGPEVTKPLLETSRMVSESAHATMLCGGQLPTPPSAAGRLAD